MALNKVAGKYNFSSWNLSNLAPNPPWRLDFFFFSSVETRHESRPFAQGRDECRPSKKQQTKVCQKGTPGKGAFLLRIFWAHGPGN